MFRVHIGLQTLTSGRLLRRLQQILRTCGAGLSNHLSKHAGGIGEEFCWGIELLDLSLVQHLFTQ